MLSDLIRVFRKQKPDARVTHHLVRGIPVVVNNTRPDIDTNEALARIDRTLALIQRYVPHHFRHLQRDFAYILVERFACRGAYFHEQKACLVELTFSVNPNFSDAEVGATILHEAMHARLHNLGFPLEMADRARQERFCRRAEMEFGELVPGGERVVERATLTLAQSDEDVAPVIDPRLAARRIAEADRQAT
ncbi:MAG: hypothetical protein QOH22_1482 [Gemmatimonadaceae bacterium]|nr:hypothetical protein [Gemmatimonadaceae bacterium]